MSNLWLIYALLLTGFLAPVRGQCDGAPTFITGTNAVGEIKSPNFDIGGEYGKSANCTWKFTPPSDGKEYALRLTVERLQLYVLLEEPREKRCLGSYNLTMKNEQLGCPRYVGGPTPGFCNAYYSSPACANISEIQGCEIKRHTLFPVPMTYFSDARTSTEDLFGTSMLFSIRYKFIECSKESTTTTMAPTTTSTTTTAPTTTSTTTTATTITLTTTMAPTTTSTTTTTTTTTSITTTTSKGITSTSFTIMNGSETTPKATVEKNPSIATGTETTVTSSGSPFPLPIVLGAGGGGLILIIIIIVVAVCLCKRRGKSSSEESQDLPLSDSIPAVRNGTNQSEVADTYDTLDGAVGTNQSVAGDTYDTLGGAVGANQSGAADTYDTLGGATAPSQPQPELYATVSNPDEIPEYALPPVGYEAPAYSTVDEVAETNQADPELYSVVSRPPNDPQPPEEGALYSAVSIRKPGVKNTVQYNKSMVDNVLYGTTEDMSSVRF